MKTVHSHFGSINQIVHNHSITAASFITPHQKMATREPTIAFAKLALHADRYDEMIEYMEAAALQDGELSREEVDGFRFAIPAEDQMSF